MASYTIDLEAFKGPLEVLLELIDQEEIDIYNIPIHRITSDFLKAMDEVLMDHRNIADFLAMAIMLLDIKSRMLLPDYLLEEISLNDEEDPRRVLLEKLLAYQELKAKALQLGYIYESKDLRLYSENNAIAISLSPKTYEPGSMDKELIQQAWERIVFQQQRFNEEEAFFDKLQREKYSVEEKKRLIQILLKQEETLDFHRLTKGNSKTEKISTFLALLKMQQEQSIHIAQPHVFDAIRIERKDLCEKN